MQAECVQEALQHVHSGQHGEGDAKPSREHTIQDQTVHHRASIHRKSHRERLVEKNERELLVRKRKRPDTQVGRGMGHCAKDKLNGFDDLVDEYLSELELLPVARRRVACRRLFGGSD